jgi:thiosulfate dehydrogenase
MGKFIFGVIIGFLLVPLGFYFYVKSGRAPVATSSAPMPFETFFAKTALHATLAREAPKTMSTKASEAELESGANVYRMHCSLCHGLPGQAEGPIAKGMFPRPPQLFAPAEMVTDDPVGVTYWKAKNGIRLSGMPGFKDSLSDAELYSVSLLLANADKLPEDIKAKLAAPFGPPPPPPPQMLTAKPKEQKRK